MQAIEYVAPSTLDEALKALSNGNVRILAGGTDLIVQARENRRNVTKMVDVKNVKETTELTLGSDGSLRVGAADCLRGHLRERRRREEASRP